MLVSLGSTAVGFLEGSDWSGAADLTGLVRTLWDGDLHRRTAADVLPADGMQEVRGSNPLSSTQVRSEIRTLRTASTAAKYSNTAGTIYAPASPDQVCFPAWVAGIAG